MAQPFMVPLPGSERTERPGARLIGPVPDDELIEFAAVMRARPDAADLAEVARAAAITGEFPSREEHALSAAIADTANNPSVISSAGRWPRTARGGRRHRGPAAQ